MYGGALVPPLPDGASPIRTEGLFTPDKIFLLITLGAILNEVKDLAV